MKTFLLLTIFLLPVTLLAQPEKASWMIGGSGYRIKMYDNGKPTQNIYEYNAEGSYFIFRNFAIECELTYSGGKETDISNGNKYHGFLFSPSSEFYFLRIKKLTGSAKGLVQTNISGNGYFYKSKTIQSYKYGPKVSWFISDNASFYSWFAFRKLLDDTSNFPGWTAVIPSENFDINLGFTIFINKKQM